MNLASQLVIYKRIKTTDAKAKELRSFIEPLVSLAKKDDLHSRRMVIRKLPHKNIVGTLFKEIAPKFVDRPGGYTRILKLPPRPGDSADMAILELVDRDTSKEDIRRESREKKEENKTDS